MWKERKSKSLASVITKRFREWWSSSDSPNPWPDEVDVALHEPDAVPVCFRCVTPCEDTEWFCPTCGAAIGPYNNVMPFIYIYSIGEALRSGVGPEAHFTRFRTVAYIAIGLAQFGVYAPLYLFRLCLNYRRLKRLPNEELGGSEDSV